MSSIFTLLDVFTFGLLWAQGQLQIQHSVFAFPIMSVPMSGLRWHMHAPYSWLWLCALFCLLLRRVEYFKPRMSRHKYKSSRDVAGAAKKCQVMMMETKVNRFEGVQWQEEEEISESEKIHKTWKGQKIVFIWGGIVSFWVTKPECRPVHEGRPVSEQQQLFRMQYSCYHVIYDEK